MYKPRDYRKPLMMRFRGLDGLRAFIRLLKAPPERYDAEKEADKALRDLRRQGARL